LRLKANLIFSLGEILKKLFFPNFQFFDTETKIGLEISLRYCHFQGVQAKMEIKIG